MYFAECSIDRIRLRVAERELEMKELTHQVQPSTATLKEWRSKPIVEETIFFPESAPQTTYTPSTPDAEKSTAQPPWFIPCPPRACTILVRPRQFCSSQKVHYSTPPPRTDPYPTPSPSSISSNETSTPSPLHLESPHRKKRPVKKKKQRRALNKAHQYVFPPLHLSYGFSELCRTR